MRYQTRICAFIWVLTASPTFAVTDEATGLSINPPEPFIATLVDDPNTTATISIEPNSNAITEDDSDHVVCKAGFREETSNAFFTQDEINDLVVLPEVIESTTGGLSMAFDLDGPLFFSVAGVTGLEFTGVSLSDFTPVYFISMQTPSGITNMMCFNALEHFPQSLPHFRAIRDAISPPP